MNAWVILPGRLKSFREEVIRYLKLSHARSTWTKIKGHDRQETYDKVYKAQRPTTGRYNWHPGCRGTCMVSRNHSGKYIEARFWKGLSSMLRSLHAGKSKIKVPIR